VRGEIWAVSAGGVARKPRPGLIIQDDSFAGHASVTFLPLTTAEHDTPMMRFPVVPNPQNGLNEHSWVMIDKITTARRSQLGERIGQLTVHQVTEIERLLMAFLGMAR